MRAPCGTSFVTVFPPRDNPWLSGESFWLGLGFFLDGHTFIGAGCHRPDRRQAAASPENFKIKRGNRIPISANAVWTISRVPGNTPRGEGKRYGVRQE